MQQLSKSDQGKGSEFCNEMQSLLATREGVEHIEKIQVNGRGTSRRVDDTASVALTCAAPRSHRCRTAEDPVLRNWSELPRGSASEDAAGFRLASKFYDHI